MAALNAPPRPDPQRHQHRAAPAFNHADAERTGGCLRHFAAHFAGGQCVRHSLQQAQRFQQLVEAHGDPRSNITRDKPDLARQQLIVGRARLIYAQVEGLAAGTAGQSGEPELQRQRRRDDSGGIEAIAHTGVLVEDFVQAFDLDGERFHRSAQRAQRVVDRIDRDVDKTAAEDKHLFRLYELAVMGSRHGLRFDFHPNAAYESFAPGQQPPASGTFENFFPAYLRYCMSFDPALVALIQTHLREQMAYIDACYPTHAGPLFNGVYLFTRSA